MRCHNDEAAVHASRSLAATDPAVGETLENEAHRQGAQIEFIKVQDLIGIVERHEAWYVNPVRSRRQQRRTAHQHQAFLE